MAGYTARWMSPEGQLWRTILDKVQEAAENFVLLQGADVSMERWDAPDFGFRWYDESDIGRSVSVFIADREKGGHELRFDISAWKDDVLTRRRFFEEIPSFAVLPVPDDLEQLGIAEIRSLLDTARNKVLSLKEEHLKKQSLLPEPDPGFNWEVHKGRVTYLPK